MGKFLKGKYQANDGGVHPIRISADAASLTIDNWEGLTMSQAQRVYCRRSRREFGFVARQWVLNRTISAGGYDLELYTTVPCLILNDWKDTSRLVNDTVTYKGATWTIIGHEPERIR